MAGAGGSTATADASSSSNLSTHRRTSSQGKPEMMWTLIVMLSQSPSGVPSQIAVAGFTSRDACASGAQTYFAEIKRLDPANLVTGAMVCVPSTVVPQPPVVAAPKPK
jgi:hypothetical protein